MPRTRTLTTGVTLVELLVVIAVLGALSFVVVAMTRPRPAHEHARMLAHAVGLQRWRSVQEGHAVVLRTSSLGNTVVAWRGRFSCEVPDGAPVLVEQRSDVTVRWPGMALAFGADGRPRRCDGSGVGNATIEVADRHGNRAAVIVAALGRVRWEPR